MRRQRNHQRKSFECNWKSCHERSQTSDIMSQNGGLNCKSVAKTSETNDRKRRGPAPHSSTTATEGNLKRQPLLTSHHMQGLPKQSASCSRINVLYAKSVTTKSSKPKRYKRSTQHLNGIQQQHIANWMTVTLVISHHMDA